MKNKTLVLALALTAIVTSGYSCSDASNEKGQVGDGGIMRYSTKSLVSSEITKIKVQDKIKVEFTTNIGIVVGLVTDNTGITLLQSKTDTSSDTYMQIDISNLASGVYTFTLINAEGNTLNKEIFIVE